MTNFLELQGFEGLQAESHMVNRDISVRLVTTMTTYPIAHNELKKAFDALKKALEAKEIHLQELDYLEDIVNLMVQTKVTICANEE